MDGSGGSLPVTARELGEPAVALVATALRTTLDTVPMGIVACDAQTRLLYGNRLVRTMLGQFTVGLPADAWQPAYDLRGPEGDPVRDVTEIPLVAALRTGEVRGARMHQRCGDGLVGLVADVVAVVDESGVTCGAVGLFEPVASRVSGGSAPVRPVGHGGRPADPGEQLRMMLAVTDLIERRRQWTEQDPLLARLDRYLSGRLHEPLDLRSIAAALAFSPAYLTHRVASLTGRPVMALVRERRMAAARSLLADTGLSVDVIATRVSPWDTAYFGRVFRQFHGCTPAQWRREGRPADRQTMDRKSENLS